MERFNDGDLTRISLNSNFDIDYDAEEVYEKGIEYIDELSKSNFFFDKLSEYIAKNIDKLSFTGDINNHNDIFNFVKACYAKEDIKGDKGQGPFQYNPANIKKWIAGNIPSQKSREEIFRLCLCLKMNAIQATEFILKGCLTKPFNFKNISESVYYFCLNNGKSYRDAIRIIEEIESTEAKDSIDSEDDTIKIREAIHNIKDEKKLVNYLATTKLVLNNKTALEELDKLVARSVEFAEWERVTFKYDNQGVSKIESKDNISEILNVILGYNLRATEDKKDVFKIKIAGSNFPKLIKENFPQEQQIQSLLTSKSGSAELIRKTIILFTFYNLFAELKMKNKDYENGHFYDFADEIDQTLQNCGYIQMYWRHPYDWMFGFCASADDPLVALREIISLCFTDVDEFYN